MNDEITQKKNNGGDFQLKTGAAADDMEIKEQSERDWPERINFVQLLMDSVPMPVFYKDIKGLYLGCNRAFEEFYGILREEIIGKSVYDIAPKELADVYHQKDQELFSNSGVQVYETVVKDKKGVDHNVIFHKSTFHGTNGKIGGVIGAIMDITEHKLAEEALSRAMLDWQDTFNAITDIITIHDKDFNIIHANKAAEDVLGLPFLEKIPGAKCFKYYHGAENPPANCPSCECLITKETATFEYFEPHLKKYLEIRAMPRFDRDNQLIGLIHIVRDITDRKRTEERITHLNRVLRTIRSVNQLIVREKDPDALVQEICNVLIQHRGYDSALIVLTHKTGEVKSFAHAGNGGAPALLSEMLRQGRLPPCCQEAKLNHGAHLIESHDKHCGACTTDKDLLPGATLCIQLKHEETVYGYLSVVLPQLQGADDEEQALFADMADDLAFALYNIERGKAVQKAEEDRDRMEAQFRQAQKMEAVGRLAGGMAHDFNNMLCVILGYAEMSMSGLNPVDPLYQDLQQVINACDRSTAMIRQLLAFSRKQIVSPQTIQLNDAVTEHLKMMARLIGEDVSIEFFPAKDLRPIRIDPSQIDQIIVNLAVNSRDAISGVGAITIETANVVLDENYRQNHPYVIPGDYVMLAFTDTGAGMNAETMERIFEPFFTTKAKGQGTGLGLSTVYGIVKQNNGTIHVYSEPGRGTTFKIYFPKFAGDVEARPEKPKVDSLKGTETILVVEDQEQLLKLTQKILMRYGYKVLIAQTPGEACLICEKYTDPIHLLLTDVIMPGMNGKELKDRIIKLKPGIKSMFMSGYTENAIVLNEILHQGVHFIQKPFETKALIHKVREALDSD